MAFNWDEERITLDETIQEFFSEFERIECLKSQANSECSEKNSPVCNTTTKASNSDYYRLNDLESWEFYVQKNNMITWRRDEGNGHYAYKGSYYTASRFLNVHMLHILNCTFPVFLVYVKYPDITAADFLFVQTDIDYRKEWDDTAVCLEVIDNDSMKGNGSEVVYWEMAWPKLFANRDYVFVRKHFIDFKRNLILIANKSTKHPNCPIKPGLQRVKDYWSFMVIKPTGPTRSFDEPGIEFVLTYFDNPGIRIPKYVTSWVAQHQMPDFIDKLYHATQRFAQKKASTWTCYQDPGYEYPSDVRLDDFEDKLTEEIIDNVNSSGTGADNVQIENLDLESEEASTKPWWNYFRLYNYLH